MNAAFPIHHDSSHPLGLDPYDPDVGRSHEVSETVVRAVEALEPGDTLVVERHKPEAGKAEYTLTLRSHK